MSDGIPYAVEVDGQTLEVAVGGHAPDWEFHIGGKKIHPHVELLAPGEYRVALHGETFHLFADAKNPDTARVEWRGRPLDVAVQEAFRTKLRTGARAQAGGGIVKTDIPGLISKIAVKEGQSVKAGDLLMVLEAMKMENEIRAKTAGVVSRLHCKPGQAVMAGDSLARIDPA